MWAADGGFHVEHHYTRIDEAPLGETVPKRTQDWYAEAGAVVSAGLLPRRRPRPGRSMT